MKKILCLVNQKDNVIILDFCLIEQQFSKIKVINRFNERIIDNHINEDVVYDINKILKEYNFIKIPFTIGLGLSDIFLDEFRIPKLSITESKKAQELELSKLYPNIKDEYVYTSIENTSDKSSSYIKHLICPLVTYRLIINLMQKLKVTVKQIVFVPSAMKQLIVTKKIFKKEQKSLFVDITNEFTYLILMQGNDLINYSIVNLGMHDLDNLIATNSETPIEEVMLKRLAGEVRFLPAFMFKNFINVIKEVKRMSYLGDNPIECCYVHSECGNNIELVNVFKKRLELNIIDLVAFDEITANNFAVISVNNTLNSKTDFVFPIKVRS